MITSTNRRPITVSGVAKEHNLKGWYDDDHRGSGSVMRRNMKRRPRQRKTTLRDHRMGR